MKIGVLIDDERLKEELLAETCGVLKEEWRFFERPEEMKQDIASQKLDFLFLSDRFFSYDDLHDWLDDIRDNLPETVPVVLLSNRHDTALNEKFRRLCVSQGLQAVFPGRPPVAVRMEMLRAVRGELVDGKLTGARLVTFIGSTPNVGTTLISFGTAVLIAQATQQSVGYLCLNLKSSKLHRYLGIDEAPAALDGLRAELKAGNLPADRLRQYCEKVRGRPNLYVLYGNMIREQAEFFQPEDVNYLLESAKTAFDLILVEVNAYWDNAATVCAMMAADSRVMVTSPDISHFQEDFRRWWLTIAPIFGIPALSCELVVNQLEKGTGSGGIRAKDIRRETGLPVIAEIGRHPDIIEYTNQGKMLELFTGAHPVSRSLSRVSEALMAQCGIVACPAAKRKPWLKRMLSAPAPGRDVPVR